MMIHYHNGNYTNVTAPVMAYELTPVNHLTVKNYPVITLTSRITDAIACMLLILMPLAILFL